MFGRGKGTYRRLQPKLTQIVLTVVAVAFLLVTIIVIWYYSTNHQKQIVDNQKRQMESTAEQITFLQTTTNNIAKQVVVDAELQAAISAKKEVSATYSITKRKANAALATYAHIVDALQEILVYTTEGRTFSSMPVRDDFDPDQTDWYAEFKKAGRQNGYTSVHLSTPSQDSKIKDVISYVLTYYSADVNRNEIGDLIISIDYNTLKQIADMDTSMLNGYCLFDALGNSILEKGELSLTFPEIVKMNKNGMIREKNGNILLISSDMQDGWMIVTEISGAKVERQSLVMGLYLAIAFLVSAVILLQVLNYFIKRIVNPINQLSEAASEVGNGNFEVNVDIRTGDELEVLADVFNKMVLDIQKLMEESVEHEKITRKMQIDKLMLQINPHFIYNTLNSIVYMARMNRNNGIADFTNAFISLLQGTLSIKDSIFISLGEELNNVGNYLTLQKYRYIDKFDVEIQCPEELKNCAIPNVMLQPIVENAIFHGIAPKEEKGLLTIKVFRTDENLVISVEDNGVGMSQETITLLMSNEKINTGGFRKIGMANVSNRMREIFGEDYYLEIESVLDRGTKISMRIPYQKWEE